MSVIPMLVHLAEFITLLLVVLAAYKIVTNYKATINTEQNASFDAGIIEAEEHAELVSTDLQEKSHKNQSNPSQKRETVLNDYIGDFF